MPLGFFPQSFNGQLTNKNKTEKPSGIGHTHFGFYFEYRYRHRYLEHYSSCHSVATLEQVIIVTQTHNYAHTPD